MESQSVWGYVCAHKSTCVSAWAQVSASVCAQVSDKPSMPPFPTKDQLSATCELTRIQREEVMTTEWWTSGLQDNLVMGGRGTWGCVYITLNITLRQRRLYKEHGVLMEIWGKTKASQFHIHLWHSLPPSEGHFQGNYVLSLTKCACVNGTPPFSPIPPYLVCLCVCFLPCPNSSHCVCVCVCVCHCYRMQGPVRFSRAEMGLSHLVSQHLAEPSTG